MNNAGLAMFRPTPGGSYNCDHSSLLISSFVDNYICLLWFLVKIQVQFSRNLFRSIQLVKICFLIHRLTHLC